MVPLSRLAARIPARLATKFVVATIVMSMLFLSLAMYSMDSGRRALEETVGAESIDRAYMFALSVDRGVYTKLHELAIISLGRAIVSDLNDSNLEFEAMADMEAYIDMMDAAWTAVPPDEVTPFMQEILDTPLSRDLTVRLEEHYLIEHGIDMYGEVVVTNRYGAVVAMTQRTTDYRQNDEVWWQETRNSTHYVGDAEYDESSHTYGLPVCYCVVGDDGEFLGLIRAVVGLVEIVAETQFEAEIYETTEAKVISSDHKLLYASTAFRMFEDVSREDYVLKMDGDSGYFRSTEGGRERLYAYTPSPGYLEYGGLSWTIVVSADTSEVFQSVTTLSYQIMVASAVVLVLFVVVAFSLSSSVSRPVAQMRVAVARMARGDLKERVDVKSSDELGELAAAFNDMAAELSELYEDLESKVQERSREVDAANAKLQILGSITRHDALNQLAILRGWLTVVEDGTKDPDILTHISKVETAAENLEAQLKFTGTYEKVGITRPEWIDAKRAIDVSNLGLDLHGAKLSNMLSGLVVYADPMFPKVLRNLVENAIKHGKGTTKVSLTYKERPEGAVIVVEDDGGGIPADRKATLFDRVRDSTGRSGYGLYLSRAILGITGITIEETGVPGVGARFEIRIPPGKYRVSRPPAAGRGR